MIKRFFYIVLCFILFSCAGKTVKSTITFLSPEEYAKALEEDSTAFLIDVRTPEEYAQGHIEGAVLMNVMDEDKFAYGIDSLSSEHTYYIYCRSGRRSQSAALQMAQKGLKVIDLQGGYNAWQEAEKKQ